MRRGMTAPPPATGTARGRYLHAATGFQSELDRLRLLEARYDGDTTRRLAALGIPDAARCLEAGAGAGSIARWMAARAGPRGHVVATDLDPRFLGGLEQDNIEVRRHDITAEDLGQGSFDIVHCRALLLHLPDPHAALQRMAAALRPGGTLLIEDADYVSLAACDPDHPHAQAFNEHTHAALRSARAAGMFDPYFGRRLPSLLATVNLVGNGHDIVTRIRHGNSADATLLTESAQAVLRAAPDQAGAARALAGVRPALTDPAFCYVDALNVAAWGRRPT
jgi:SAM-dependent methyltransferase